MSRIGLESRLGAALAALAALAAVACEAPPSTIDRPGSLDLTRAWRSAELPDCAIASPLLVGSQGQEVLLTALSSGVLLATSPADGTEIFRVTLTAPLGQEAHIAATPGVLGTRVVVACCWPRPSATAARPAPPAPTA